jgi:hypothetical protein
MGVCQRAVKFLRSSAGTPTIMGYFMVLLSPPDKYRDGTLNEPTIASFHVISNTLPSDHAT